MAAEAVEWQPQFLDVDPVYGVVFALYCERRGIRLPSLRFILASYEFVSVVHRRILERAFGVPVLNLYGSTETGHLLMEVGRGEMRASLETAMLEVVNTDPQGISELAVTTLTNDFMPLIRYRIGDLVERHELPYCTNYMVHGRAKDAFVLAGARRVTTWQIDQCLTDLRGVAHYQLCERASGEWLLRFVPDSTPPTAADVAELGRRVEKLLGVAGKLTVEQTDLLAPESSGKFRLGYPAR
jgi:phenylacetate-CoA ligase